MPEPHDWKTIDDALYDWIVGELGVDVIWANQNVPQPAYPYVTLMRSGTEEVSSLDETRETTDLTAAAGEEIELETTGPREITLTVTAHAEPCETEGLAAGKSGVDLLSKAQSSLGKLSVLDALGVAGVALIERLPVLDTSVVVNARWISQASMEVRLRVTASMTEQTGYIDKVELSSTITGAKASLNLDDFLIDGS
jgi:hypothetical protein